MAKYLAVLLGLVISLTTCRQEKPPETKLDVVKDPIVSDIEEAIVLHGRYCSPYCGMVRFKEVHHPHPNSLAYTSFLEVGLSTVKYDGINLLRLRSRYGKVAVIGIMLHEMGHHRDLLQKASEDNIDDWFTDSWIRELSADWWSGCVVQLAGLPLQDWKGAVTEISPYPSTSHPGWPLRVKAVQLGADKCSQIGAVEALPEPPEQ